MGTQEQAKHTPGPWKLGYGGGVGKGHLYAPGPNTPFGNLPLGAAFFPGLYKDGTFTKEAIDTMNANAHLMVAAPDLLAASKAAHKFLFDYYADACLDTCQKPEEAAAFYAVRDMLTEAIAKAVPD